MIDSLQFERLVSASGPTSGELKRPSDGAMPKNVVFISCVGSRDNAKGMSYCSKICCMYTAKHTMLYKHKVHDGQAHVFYMDIRSGGKGYDEFVRRAIEQDGAKYYRGRVSKITEENGKLIVRGADTLAGDAGDDRGRPGGAGRGHAPGRRRRGTGPEAERGLRRVRLPAASRTPSCGRWRPTRRASSSAGACQAPKDIPESVAQASAAAGKVLVMFAAEELTREPEIAAINEQTCAACFACVRACPYHAIEQAEVRDRKGRLHQAHGARESRTVHGLRHLRGRLPLEERRPGRASPSKQIYAMVGEPGMSETEPSSSRRSSPTCATGAPTWAPTWRARPAWNIRPTCASSACLARGGSTST